MAKRKEQFRKQQIATVGHNSNKFNRRMEAQVKKAERIYEINYMNNKAIVAE